MILSSVSGANISSFETEDYQQMYHFPLPLSKMDAPFYISNSNTNTRDILKQWVRDPSNFRTTCNQIYRMKMLRKEY